MSAGVAEIPVLARVEDGGVVRGFSDAALHPPAVACAWGGIRATLLAASPQIVPRGHLLNNVVTLNLGGQTTSEANFEGRGWQTHRTPHHGVGLFPALVEYAVREHDAREFLAVEMAPEFVDAALAGKGAGAPLHPIIGAQDAFAEHVLLALAEEARTGSAAQGALLAQSLGTALVAHLAELDHGEAQGPEIGLPSQKLRRVLDYIASHLDAPLTLRTLAGLAGLDVFRFIRAFKQTTGLSPHRYVLEARIGRSKQLLRNRAMSITEIALETGFATPSHFSVTFRRLVSVTPRAYRDSLP